MIGLNHQLSANELYKSVPKNVNWTFHREVKSKGIESKFKQLKRKVIQQY